MGSIFKIALIICDALVIAITDNKIAKIFGVIAIICMGISLLLGA